MQPPIGAAFAKLALLEHQRAYPPLTHVDRAAVLYEMMRPRLPVDIRELVTTGHLAIGESDTGGPSCAPSRFMATGSSRRRAR